MTLADLMDIADFAGRQGRKGYANLTDLLRQVWQQDYSLDEAQRAARSLGQFSFGAAKNVVQQVPQIPAQYREVRDRLSRLPQQRVK